MTEWLKKHLFLLICLAMMAATLIAYEPIRHNEFVYYDDQTYLTENPNIDDGITYDSVIWAFTSTYGANWHPVTWLSHMLDYELYGLRPLGHHITNLLFHIANTLLLFWLLKNMTDLTSSPHAGAIWKSAFVAAAFALHPIHVESVAWAAERKDVLSTLFWMMTMLAYVRYARSDNSPSTAKFVYYGLVIVFFVMGLMSKPMVVTLPFVLLLLDYWPLDRFQNFKVPFFKLIYEKIPLFVLSVASCVITFAAQRSGGAMANLMAWPWNARIVTALGGYFSYVVKILFPTNLAVFYPYEGKISIQPALAVILGAALLLYYWGRGRRWLAMGLLWYLGTLVPVIGLVQIGDQMTADRYTYIPSIGIFIIIAWGIEEIFSSKHYPKALLIGVAAVAIAAMILVTRAQTGYWRDTPTLFKRAIAVTKNNYNMLNNYGGYLCLQGNFDEGLKYSQEALRIYPNFMPARNNVCIGLLSQKKLDEAINCFNETLQMANEWADAYKLYYGLGLAYARKGNFELAEINLKKALTLRPEFAPAQQYLSLVQAKQRQKTSQGGTSNFQN